MNLPESEAPMRAPSPPITPELATPRRVPCAVTEGVDGAVFCALRCPLFAGPIAVAECAFGATCAACGAMLPDDAGTVVMFVPMGTRVPSRGWRASFVVEGERGHHPSGDWPYTRVPGATMPTFLGPSYEEATVAAARWNEARGVDPRRAAKIVIAAVFGGGQ